MYLLDEEKLNKGDIILLKFDTEKSRLIRRFSQSEYSHAMLYVGGSSLIDADGPGVHSRNLQRFLIPNKEDVIVLRYENPPRDQIWNVEQFVRSKIGTEYSMEEARKVVRNGQLVPEDNRQFCTRLVAKAYEYAGLNIVDKPDYCSPKDLEDSTKLLPVENPLRTANEKEISYANETDTATEKQTGITNTIFENIRKLSSEDIQTFEQLDELLIRNPQYDQEITKIIIDSGYLDIWKRDIQKNPWYYDFDAFQNHYGKSQYVDASKVLIGMSKELFIRYTLMHEYYTKILLSNKLAYFDIMHRLYSKLLDLNKQRITVAMDAMIEAGLSEEEITSIGLL